MIDTMDFNSDNLELELMKAEAAFDNSISKFQICLMENYHYTTENSDKEIILEGTEDLARGIKIFFDKLDEKFLDFFVRGGKKHDRVSKKYREKLNELEEALKKNKRLSEKSKFEYFYDLSFMANHFYKMIDTEKKMIDLLYEFPQTPPSHHNDLKNSIRRLEKENNDRSNEIKDVLVKKSMTNKEQIKLAHKLNDEFSKNRIPDMYEKAVKKLEKYIENKSLLLVGYLDDSVKSGRRDLVDAAVIFNKFKELGSSTVNFSMRSYSLFQAAAIDYINSVISNLTKEV